MENVGSKGGKRSWIRSVMLKISVSFIREVWFQLLVSYGCSRTELQAMCRRLVGTRTMALNQVNEISMSMSGVCVKAMFKILLSVRDVMFSARNEPRIDKTRVLDRDEIWVKYA